MSVYEDFDLFECDFGIGNPAPAASAPSDGAGQTSDSTVGGPDMFGAGYVKPKRKKKYEKDNIPFNNSRHARPAAIGM